MIVKVIVRDYRPEGGESWRDVYERRVSTFMARLVTENQDRPEGTPLPHVLAISHGGFIKEVMNWALARSARLSLGGEAASERGFYPNSAGNTSVYRFLISYEGAEDFDANIRIRVLIENNVDHLRLMRVPMSVVKDAEPAAVDVRNVIEVASLLAASPACDRTLRIEIEDTIESSKTN